MIALLTGYSYGQLGLSFRGNGGSFTYIQKGFGRPGIAGVAGWLLVAGYVGTLALYATAFGDYGATFFVSGGTVGWLGGLIATVGLLVFLGVNLFGAKLSGGVELGVVGTKLAILGVFAAMGLWGIHMKHFEPIFNRGLIPPLSAIALIFVAYEGFELIPNAVDEMKYAERDLKRALMIAISATTLIYVVVAVAALGNLTRAEILQDKEYVLAVAARPTLGHAGFVLIAVAAVLSTASAINATLFGAGRLAMVMAEHRALPQIFAKKEEGRGVPYAALLVLTGLSVAFTLTADLAVISSFASATFLLIFTMVNVSALRLAKEIKLQRWVPLLAAILCGASFAGLLWHDWTSDRTSLAYLLGFYGFAVAAQAVLRWSRRRSELAA